MGLTSGFIIYWFGSSGCEIPLCIPIQYSTHATGLQLNYFIGYNKGNNDLTHWLGVMKDYSLRGNILTSVCWQNGIVRHSCEIAQPQMPQEYLYL